MPLTRRRKVRLPLGLRQAIYNLIIGGPGVVAATVTGIVTHGDIIATGAAAFAGLVWAIAVQGWRDSPRERAAQRESDKLQAAVDRFNDPRRVINDERLWKQQQKWRRRPGCRDRRYGE
jgi:hypothetical protein